MAAIAVDNHINILLSCPQTGAGGVGVVVRAARGPCVLGAGGAGPRHLAGETAAAGAGQGAATHA